MKKTFYEKRGRRYVPVHEYDSDLTASFGKGAHVVVCKPGQTIYKYNVDADCVPLIAAGIHAREALLDALVHASELKPARAPITPEQAAAWKALADSFGDELATLQGPSLVEVADAGVSSLISEAERMLTNPAVRQAYEHFLFMVKLTQESEHEPRD